MERRTVFGAMAAGIFGLFGGCKQASAQSTRDPFAPTEFDSKGGSCKRLFKFDETSGRWLRVKRKDIRTGDKVIIIGLREEDGSLSTCEITGVGEIFPDKDGNGGGFFVDQNFETVSLLNK